MPFTPITSTTPNVSAPKPDGSGGFQPIGSAAAPKLDAKNAPAAVTASGSLLDFMAGVGKNIGAAANEQIHQGAEDINANADMQKSGAGAGTKLKSEAMAGLNLAGDTANAIFAPFAGALKSVSDAAGNTDFVQKVAAHPAVAGFLDKTSDVSKKLQAWAEAHPDASRALGDVVSVAGLVGGGKGAQVGAETAAGGLKTGAEAAVKAAGGAGKALADSRFQRATELVKPTKIEAPKADTEAWKLLAPKPTAAVEKAYRAEGAVGKQGIFKGAEFQPLKADTKMIDAVRPLMQTGEIKAGMDPAEIHSVISRKVSQLDSDVKNFVAENTAPIEESVLDGALQKTKDENNILFKTDPNTERVYDEVIAEFKKYVRTGQKVIDADSGKESIAPHGQTGEMQYAKNGGPSVNFTDSKAVFDARRGFDKLIEKKFPQAFAQTKTGDLSPSNNAVVTALRDVRGVANDVVAESLPENSPYKPILKSETGLLNAMKRVDENAVGTAAHGKIQDIYKRNPWIKRAAELFGVGAIVGTGDAVVHSLAD